MFYRCMENIAAVQSAGGVFQNMSFTIAMPEREFNFKRPEENKSLKYSKSLIRRPKRTGTNLTLVINVLWRGEGHCGWLYNKYSLKCQPILM